MRTKYKVLIVVVSMLLGTMFTTWQIWSVLDGTSIETPKTEEKPEIRLFTTGYGITLMVEGDTIKVTDDGKKLIVSSKEGEKKLSFYLINNTAKKTVVAKLRRRSLKAEKIWEDRGKRGLGPVSQYVSSALTIEPKGKKKFTEVLSDEHFVEIEK